MIKKEGVKRLSNGLAKYRLGNKTCVNCQHRVTVGDAGVGSRVTRIDCDGLLKISECFTFCFLVSLIPIMAALQIGFIGSWIDGMRIDLNTVSCGKFDTDLFRRIPRNVVLQY